MRALIFIAALLTYLIVAAGCGAGDINALADSSCASCPDGHVEVDRCPAFTTCEEIESCDDTLICAPVEEEDANQVESDAGAEPCEAPTTECPPGSEEVSYCPDGFVCTRITYCDESLLCVELGDACDREPLCPDGDRGVEDYDCHEDDYTCYRHYHCSGPISCLRCEELPEVCPDDLIAIDPEECDDQERPCERVETCEETLFCAAPECIDPTCPGESVPWERCEEEDPNCFALDACGEEDLFCGAPPDEDPDCRAIPTCPEYYEEVILAECLSEREECSLKATCGVLIGCLPSE